MNEKQLMNLQQLLKAAERDCGCLTVEEVDDLRIAVESELYVTRIKDFKCMLDAALPNMPNDTPERQAVYDEAMDDFYSTQWTIRFGYRSVTIDNDATVYNGICDMLTDLIDNCL